VDVKTALQGQDLLIVIDIQRDFCAGGALEVTDAESLIVPLNQLIQRAAAMGHKIVFTCDWHPQDHQSFQNNGGPWPPHCVAGTAGADFHAELLRPDDAETVHKGVESDALSYSAFENTRLRQIVDQNEIRTIYVVGIALEYCVLATSISATQYDRTVVALEPYIRAVSADPQTLEQCWRQMTDQGVVRAQEMAQ
jgi:nicotinamidase/pyrazinamidase